MNAKVMTSILIEILSKSKNKLLCKEKKASMATVLMNFSVYKNTNTLKMYCQVDLLIGLVLF